ncbi:MAG: DUF6504 family protein [Actinomycetes bacterium]
MWVQPDHNGAPARFRWRGRGYTVVAVLFSWLESAAWWRLTSHDTHVWRVEASSDTATGIYDIACTDEQWFVRRVMD